MSSKANNLPEAEIVSKAAPLSALDKKRQKYADNVEKLRSGKVKSIPLPSLWTVNAAKQEILEQLDKIVVWNPEAKRVLMDIIWLKLFSDIPNTEWVLWIVHLLGSTWVGKTLIARALAKILLWSEKRITKIPWEQYMLQHMAASLFSAPPWYIWHWSTLPKLCDINLTKHYETAKKKWELHPLVRLKEGFFILVLDEFDKMHPDTHQSFLWIFEDWELELPTWKEDNLAIKYSKITFFHNWIIIITSNTGTKAARKKMWFWADSASNRKQIFEAALSDKYSEELLWRINRNTVVLDDLTTENAKEIVKNRVEAISTKELKAYKNIVTVFTPRLEDYLVGKGFNQRFWARQLVKTVEYEALTEIERAKYEWQFENVTFPVILKADWVNGKTVLSLQFDEKRTAIELKRVPAVAQKVRQNAFEIVKQWYLNIPLHNGSLLWTYEQFSKALLNYVKLQKLREECWEEFEDEIEMMEEHLKSLWFTKNDIHSLRTKAMLSILEEHFAFIDDYCGLELSVAEEKTLFTPYDWSVIKKISERKYDEMLKLDSSVSLEYIVSEIEDIICKLMGLRYLSSAQLIELTKLIHHHHISRNIKK
ncbi:MAG: Clp protease ATP binding subunit [uncultured bacterium (gcode 4)]|uniref:Clp protease ATP binding subunit n=1 Tax=uncultured bacterium (gcode 4) TaxID=1234023 RepID=K2FCZ7_9BACT|nr:MAG: Clp protease ATP binding subunit [uncultured bacterium (gcode 4)]